MQEVKEILEQELGLNAKIIGNVVKAHTTKLRGRELSILADIYSSEYLGFENIEIKRSGTGITIIVTFE